MTQHRLTALLGAAGALTLLAPGSAQIQLATTRLVSGLTQPLWVGVAPGVEDTLFVCQQNGQIRLVRNGQVAEAPFLNVRSKILTGSERGLLGLAFHPDYESNGYFYIDYTRSGDGATIVERYSRSASNPDVADPNSGQIILGPIAQPFSNHNGGCLQFGPDGYLYISTGDGGSAGDPGCRAQNTTLLLGKILRIDVDGGTPYAIPPSNPFVGMEGRDEIWTFGWRNPWRFSFDRATGDVYVGDVGQSAREEISFHPASSSGGENYGWKIMEGTQCYSTTACSPATPPCNDPSLVLPIHDYGHTGGNCSVTGGYVYRGCALPSLRGTYFFADYCSARIWSLRYDGQAVSQLQERTTELASLNGGTIGSITSFGEDSQGEIIIVDRGGELFQIVARAGLPAVDLGFGKVGSNGLQPRFQVCGRLEAGESAQLVLRFAPANAPAALVLSDMQSPTTFPFGTVVPIPPRLVVPAMTAANGEVDLPVAGGLGPAVLYGQWGVLDAGTSGGVGLSNALQITFP